MNPRKLLFTIILGLIISSILLYLRYGFNHSQESESATLNTISENSTFSSKIIEEINCVRQHKQLKPIYIDEQLSQEAKKIKQVYATSAFSDQIELLKPYDWSLVSPLFMDQKNEPGCGWQDFDPTTFSIDHITKVGIAIEEGYSVPSVLIIGKEE